MITLMARMVLKCVSRLFPLLFLAVALHASTVGAAEPASLFDNLPTPDFSGRGWSLPPFEYGLGIVVGLAFSLYSVFKIAQSASSAKPALTLRKYWIDHYGYVRALMSNGFVWVYVLLVVSLAGLTYSGFFELLRERVAESLPLVVSWAPAGASMMATFVLTLLARRFSWMSPKGLELDRLVQNIEDESATADKRSWLSILLWSSLEDRREQKITELAQTYSTGLIKHAIQSHCDFVMDRGRVKRAEVSALLKQLRDSPVGDDERRLFINRRRAIRISSRILPLQELEQIFKSKDRRMETRRSELSKLQGAQERRGQGDRRHDGAQLEEPAC